MPVTAFNQTPAEGIDIQLLADLQVQTAGLQVFAWRQPVHGRIHRRDKNAPLHVGQPYQCRQPFRNNVLVGRKNVVGQRFPVRKKQDGMRGLVALVKPQFIDQPLCREAVRRQRQYGFVGGFHEGCQGQ